jgi:energy-coupling factor transporter ATP-binding protein EcfA2
MKFVNLSLRNWRQFDSIDIEFNQCVTILTGANGAGKSTLLRLLSEHFGWSSALLGTPYVSKTGDIRYGYRGWDEETNSTINQHDNTVGTITYTGGLSSSILIPPSSGISYSVRFSSMRQLEGVFINSHRPILNYQPVANIPTTTIRAEQAYQQYWQETRNRQNNSYTQFSPAYRMKEALISMATFGPGNRNVLGNPESEKVYADFEEILRKILPPDLGFQKLSVRIPDIVLVTETGDFVFDAASGGLMSLIDLAWQIFLYSRGKSGFIVVLDEPENHLHPSMQRTILQNLVLAFPDTQFIIATHSPFIVSSVRDASVYVLRYTNSVAMDSKIRSISSILLDQVSKAGTASEILRDALGVPITIPIWAEDALRTISAEYSIERLSEERIIDLKARLEAAGLAEFYPDALRQVASRT